MKRFTFSLLIALLTALLCEAKERETFNLYPSVAPNQTEILTEVHEVKQKGGNVKPVCRITGVDTPTITIFKANKRSKNNRVVIVAPGGGYGILSWDAEGKEVCKFLNSKGVDAVLLKYRVPRRKGVEKHAAALEDMQRAISVVRGRANEFGFNPNDVGVMGFSAGAHLSVMASTTYNQRVYTPIDSYDTQNLRPDFAILIYPAYLDGKAPFSLANDVKPTKDTPPTFFVHAQDDKTFINCTFVYANALKNLGVPIAVNIYPEGGHGHGLRPRGMMIDNWPEELAVWLKTLEVKK